MNGILQDIDSEENKQQLKNFYEQDIIRKQTKKVFQNPYEALKPYIGHKLTYAYICKVLNMERLKGSSRKAFLKDLLTYFDTEKINSSYLFLREYNEDEHNLLTTPQNYNTIIQNLLGEYIRKNFPDDCAVYITLTNRSIAENTSMVNNKFYKTKYNPYDYIANSMPQYDTNYTPREFQKIKTKDTQVFFNISTRLINKLIENAIVDLNKRGLIFATQSFRLYTLQEVQIQGKKEEIYYGQDCTPEQVREILNLQLRCLNAIGLKDMKDLYYCQYEQRQQFFVLLRQSMEESEILNYSVNYARTYKIICSDAFIKGKYNEKWSRIFLNKKIYDSFSKSQQFNSLRIGFKTPFLDAFIAISPDTEDSQEDLKKEMKHQEELKEQVRKRLEDIKAEDRNKLNAKYLGY